MTFGVIENSSIIKSIDPYIQAKLTLNPILKDVEAFVDCELKRTETNQVHTSILQSSKLLSREKDSEEKVKTERALNAHNDVRRSIDRYTDDNDGYGTR